MMYEAKPRFRKGAKVSYCYGNEYEGVNLYKVVTKYVPLGCFPRYDITNGITILRNVREKDLVKA